MDNILPKNIITTLTIVEDDVDLLTLIQDYFSTEGYRVLAYSDGIVFADAMKNKSISPDLIIMDVDLPFKSGIRTIYELSLRMNIKDIPILFLTGKQDDITINLAFENNIENIQYMLKPVNFVLLHMTVKKMLLLTQYYNSIVDANKSLFQITQQLKRQNKKDKEIIQNIMLSEPEKLKTIVEELSQQLLKDDRNE